MQSPPTHSAPPHAAAVHQSVLLVSLGLFLAVLLWAWWPRAFPAVGRPAVQPAAQVAFPVECVSYAPFRRAGHTPFDPHLSLSAEQLREDLRLISNISRCVRLYGTSHGQDQVPALAGELGMDVVLGAWISRDPQASRQELERALALAQEHPTVVKLLVVGNEVLLRQERTPEDLAALLRETRARSPVPVAYADVWEFWRRNSAVLAPHVDVVAVHILPYWEDEPVALEQAVDHVRSIAQAMQAHFAPLPVWLAETGWPAVGRQRGPARAGAPEQAAFVRELLNRPPTGLWGLNVIEAFDQPWKRALEGAMGGAWGLISADGLVRVDPRTTVIPVDPQARAGVVGAGLGAVVGLVWALLSRSRGQRPSPWTLLLRVLGLSSAIALLAHHLSDVPQWARGPGEWAQALMLLALAALAWIKPHRAAARVPVLFLLSAEALALVFDGRYRPLAWSLPAALAVVWLLASHSQGAPHPHRDDAGWARAQLLLGTVLLMCAAALVLVEGPHNQQALALAASWVAVACAAHRLRRPHPPFPA